MNNSISHYSWQNVAFGASFQPYDVTLALDRLKEVDDKMWRAEQQAVAFGMMGTLSLIGGEWPA